MFRGYSGSVGKCHRPSYYGPKELSALLSPVEASLPLEARDPSSSCLPPAAGTVTELAGQLTHTAQQLEEQHGVTWSIQRLEGRAQEKSILTLTGFLGLLGLGVPSLFPI